jgi:hypothetical protein
VLSICEANHIPAILNHRLHTMSALGHYTVFLRLTSTDVVVHDPQFGPQRLVPHAHILSLWKPLPTGSEITGNIIIALRMPTQAPFKCSLCNTPVPSTITCPYCSHVFPLSPRQVLGCVSHACKARLWAHIICPSCDSQVSSTDGQATNHDAAQQLDGADPASRAFGFGAILALAGRAAHLEAVRRSQRLAPKVKTG